MNKFITAFEMTVNKNAHESCWSPFNDPSAFAPASSAPLNMSAYGEAGIKALSIKGIPGITPGISYLNAIVQRRESIEGCGAAVLEDGTVISSYPTKEGTVYMHFTKDGYRATVVNNYGEESLYVAKIGRKSTGRSILAPMFGLLAYAIFSDDNTAEGAKEIQKILKKEFQNIADDNAFEYGAILANEIFFMLKEEAMFVKKYGSALIHSDRITDQPLKMDLSNEYKIVESFGDIKGFMPEKKTADEVCREGVERISDLARIFDPDPTRILTEEEEKLVPEIDGDYVIPSMLTYAGDLIKKSTGTKNPFRNFILRGPAGTGKTEWCKILAASMHRPYVFFGCSTDTEKMDLTMSIIPNGDVSEGNAKGKAISTKTFMDSIPSLSDIVYDPAEAYERITGIQKADASEEECTKAILDQYGSVVSSEAKGFRYVYSSLIQAFKYGWVCEVQEPTIMTRPGVLASLNSMFDRCGRIALMNGEVITRHPDAVIIYTTNTSYEGCYSLNQSALSRMTAIDLTAPEDDEIEERLIASTGYKDRVVLRKMIAVYRACLEYANQKAITDGAIDMRALEDWASANAINKAVYVNGMHMLIAKCSNEPDLQAEFMNCLDSRISPKD